MPSTLSRPKTTTPARWLSARRKLLSDEKALTRLQDKVAAQRRQLPWVKIEKDYVFTSPKGRVRLADLFGGRSQLIVQHFMLGPGWGEGCKSCSFMMDHFVPTVTHLAARDVAFAAISLAPIAEIQKFRKRMGWDINWVSAHDTDFNQDFHVSFDPRQTGAGKVFYNFEPRRIPQAEEMPGVSVFAKNARGAVYHTYSTYGRGVELIMATYDLLDITPKGRDEASLDYGMEWVRHHDRYRHVLAKV